MKALILTAGVVIALAAPAMAQRNAPAAKAANATSAKATFKNAEGKEIGTASLTQTSNGVLIRLDVRDLPAGEHAFHVHQVGRCDGADGFKSAGDHFAPGGKKHGFETAGGPHAGDMPNQFVGQDGTLKAHVVNRNISLAGGQGALFDRDGSALVIHAKPDDYKSQPAGDAGDRIACAVIERQ